jgi:hypothetical protein
MLRDARPGRSTTGEKQRGGCYSEYQRDTFQFARLFKSIDEISKTSVSH